MNGQTRKRDQQWVSDYESERRRNRSATLPSHTYDPRAYQSPDPRYDASRAHRQDPRYPPYSYHQPPQPTSRAYQHASRTPAQHPQPSPHQPSPAYPPAAPSRRPHPDPPEPRTSRRPPPPSPHDHLPTPEDMPRPSTRSTRPAHPSMQPSYSTPANQPYWNPPQDVSSSRRHRDAYRDRDRDQERERDRERERERERDRPPPEPETRYKDRSRVERHRDRDRERPADVRYQDSTRTRYNDRRKDSDTEAAVLSSREGYASAREQPSGHRRHRTEDGTASTGRRHHPENTQNPINSITSHSTSAPQPNPQQTAEPPPAPRVLPLHLPAKPKPQRPTREDRPPTATGAQSGSDTERATAKHRMERTPSGPAVQRSNAHTSTSTRDRANHDPSIAHRDDVKRQESRHHDVRHPLAPINVDIPLVTPGFKASTLPTETRTTTVPQIVSIRAGQGPSDPHDAHFKSSAISHSDAPQESVLHAPHPTSASIVKSSPRTRSHFSETRVHNDHPPVAVEYPHPKPHGIDLPPGERVSIHESSRALPTPISKPSYRESPETAGDIATSSYPHSRPPSRSAHRTSVNNAVPPAVVVPRPARSASHGPQTNEPPTRPPSVAHFVPTISSVPVQRSVPPSPHQSNGTPSKAGPQLSSVQPSPKYAQFHGASPSQTISQEQPPSAPLTAHPTPTVVLQTPTSSRPSTRNGIYMDVPYTGHQSMDQQPTASNYPEPRQVSNNTTVKASWVVQTNAKKTKIGREDKYLRDHRLDLESPQEQLRQVLSQDDPFPRASLSMVKTSQATTPSQRNSPGMKANDVSFGTPRGTLASNSPKSRSAREAPTPEQVARHSLPPHLAGPPRISVVGATPVTMNNDLPHGRVDHSLLAPPFPAPARSSRSISSSQDPQFQSSQPVVRSISSTSYHPPLAPTVHTPSLFQPYQPPSPPTPEETGQFSPPPIPVPPPRGPDDSPPPPVETRTSEIIPTRLQSDDFPQSYVSPFREVQSEMLHIPSQPFALLQPLPASPPESMQPPKVDSDMVPIATSNRSVATVHGDTRSSKPPLAQPDDVHIVHQEIMRSALASQPSGPPTRLRSKVTVEDVPDDSPVLSRGSPVNMMTSSMPVSRQISQHTTVANAPSTLKPVVMDQPGNKSSPQLRTKDQPLYRNSETSVMEAPSPIPPPGPAAALTPTRVPFSAPPQHTFPPPLQTAPAQRTASNTATSRTYQRAVDMLQASKPSTSAGANPGHLVNVNKPIVASVQTTYNPVSATTGQYQPANVASASRPVATPATGASHPSASAPASMTKFMPTSGPLVGAQPTSAPSTSINTQPPSAPDSFKHQPIRPAPLSIPPQDAISSTVMSTTAVKNVHQEQSIPDTIRPRDVAPSATRNFSSSSHMNPPTRPGPSSATIQQTHVPPTQPPTHNRTVSLPTTSFSAVQKPPSPRKYLQPISSATVSTQPFPGRPIAPESQSLRVPVSVPAPVRPTRPSPDHTNDSDMLKTPSSIAPSPMLNPDNSNGIPQSIAVPIRARKESTESRDDKKKGLFGIFRTRTLSKTAEPPPFPSVTDAPLEQGKAHPDVSATVSTSTPMSRGVTSTSAPPKQSHSIPPAVASTSARMNPQPRSKGRVPDPFVIPPPPKQTAREQRDTTPHIFTPFKFLHSKRNRTVSAASLDVCDGNTATNTVVGSPDHSAISQVQPLPAIIPPGVRDPLVAASEWREREEAERKGKVHRVRRPGVTFDLEEEPPSPAPGTASRRKRLVRRPSGRAPTPGPPRG